MGDLADAVRPDLIPGIHAVVGMPVRGFSEWIQTGNYQFFAPVTHRSRFIVTYSDDAMINSICYDINRFCMASFESIASVRPDHLLPKSTSWLAVRVYYAAYYAASAILRMFGRVLTRIDEDAAAHLEEVANLYAALTVSKIDTGLYLICPDTFKNTLNFDRRDRKRTAHAALWFEFNELLKDVATKIITRSAIASPDRLVVNKLDEFLKSITIGGSASGPYWLTETRNTINYKLKLGAWYPYLGRNKTFVNTMYGAANMWTHDPMKIDVRRSSIEDFVAYIRACCFVVVSAGVKLTHPAG